MKAVGTRTEDYLRNRPVGSTPNLVVLDQPRAGVGRAVTRRLAEEALRAGDLGLAEFATTSVEDADARLELLDRVAARKLRRQRETRLMRLLWALRSALFVAVLAITVVPWGLAMLVLSICQFSARSPAVATEHPAAKANQQAALFIVPFDAPANNGRCKALFAGAQHSPTGRKGG